MKHLILLAFVATVAMTVTGCGSGQSGPAAGHPPASAAVVGWEVTDPVTVSAELPNLTNEVVTTEGGASQVDLPETSPPPRLSPPAAEVVRLAQSQLSEEILLAYVAGVEAPFELGVAEILYLNDLGIPSPVIAAMIGRDRGLGMSDLPNEAAADVVITPSAGTTDDVAEEPPLAAMANGDTIDAAAAEPVALPPANESVEVEVVEVSQDVEPVQVTNNYFHSTLAPYGSWIEVPDYGLCWRPTVAVVDSGWRPYCHGGRWVYTDCGWYWHSYYSWGWAPFHYGRWHLSSACGWVWVPGHVWGPAWVTWRHTGDYYGWAPLPPGCVYTRGVGLFYGGARVTVGFGFGLSSSCYTFVTAAGVCSPRPWNYCAPGRSVQQIYHNSTVVNNYVSGNGNNVVVNVGPGTSSIARATRSEIRTVSLRDVDHAEGRIVQPAGSDFTRDTLAVYRPKVPAHGEEVATASLGRSARLPRNESRPSLTPGSESAAPSVVRNTAAQPARSTAVDTGASRIVQPSSARANTPRQPSRQVTETPARSAVQPTVSSTTSSTARGRVERSESSISRSQPAGTTTATSRSTSARSTTSVLGPSRTETRSTTQPRSTYTPTPSTVTRPESRSIPSVALPRVENRTTSTVRSPSTSPGVNIRSQPPSRIETRSVPSTSRRVSAPTPMPTTRSYTTPSTVAPSRPMNRSYRTIPSSPTQRAPLRTVAPSRTAPPTRMTVPRSAPPQAPSVRSTAPAPARSAPVRPASPSQNR